MEPLDPNRPVVSARLLREERSEEFLDLTKPRHRLLGLGSATSSSTPSSSSLESKMLGQEMGGNAIASSICRDACKTESMSKLLVEEAPCPLRLSPLDRFNSLEGIMR
jgi:hypothetical protein